MVGVLPWYGVLLFVAGFGFVIGWPVCRYLFGAAHAWYGSGSFAHRVYDGCCIGSAVGAFYI